MMGLEPKNSRKSDFEVPQMARWKKLRWLTDLGDKMFPAPQNRDATSRDFQKGLYGQTKPYFQGLTTCKSIKVLWFERKAYNYM